ncbi:MAG: Ldh family oxidoreductase [Pseudomonadota bacterium]
MVAVTLAKIYDTAHAALIKHGATSDIAGHVADAVAKAESHGNKICGLYYLESYCQQLKTGRVKGDVEPAVSVPRAGEVVVDACFGFAQPAFAAGVGTASVAAKEAGISRLSICHAHTCTSLGYFTEQIAAAGLIGMGFTNASPIVAPPGGQTRVIGTNPMAVSVPDGKGGMALHFDGSTTTVALGKITQAKAAGESIPLGWAVDKNGTPTTDPSEALTGSLMSLGGLEAGYKGWGLGLMVEILAAGLCGGRFSRDVEPLKAPNGSPHDLGQFYILIDPSNAPDFADRMVALSNAVTSDPGCRMPGQSRRGADPVDLGDDIWELAQSLAR